MTLKEKRVGTRVGGNDKATTPTKAREPFADRADEHRRREEKHRRVETQ